MKKFKYNELQEKTNLTPLMIATVLNEPMLVDELLFLGADVNEINTHEETALHLAFQEKNEKIMEKLILLGANLKSVSFTGNVVYRELYNILSIPDEELTPTQEKMKPLALKYASKPLSVEEESLIQKINQANALRLIEGFSPSEMKKNPKATDIANFFMFSDKKHLIQSLHEYVGHEKFLQTTNLNKLLLTYPASLYPTPFVERGEEDLLSNKILKKINVFLPPHRYLSSSWFQYQQVKFSISEEENDFIQLANRYIQSHEAQYNYVKRYPTFENIRKTGLANCGELADACLHEQRSENSDIQELKNASFLRANIKVKLPNEKGELTWFQHVFLICEPTPRQSMNEMISNLMTDKSQSIDIWKRRAGYTKDLIINHLLQAGVSYAQIVLTHPQTNEKRNLDIRYSKEEKKLFITPLQDASYPVQEKTV